MASTSFRRGFKAQAERIAEELRRELALSSTAILEPRTLAEHLYVPVISLHDLRASAVMGVTHFLGRGRRLFSAATVYVTRYRRVIVTNPAHASTRQMNSVCHELSHIILEHEAETPLNVNGGRSWNGAQEREADWLAGCLLIPQAAAFTAAKAGHSDEIVAELFGVSRALASWRMNSTGARIRATRLARLQTRS